MTDEELIEALRDGDELYTRIAAADRLEALTQPSGKVSDERIGEVSWAKVRVDTPPDEYGWCFCTPFSAHPKDVEQGFAPEEWSVSGQFFGQVIEAAQLPARFVLLPLDELIRPLDGVDRNQPGYTHAKGWNDAIMHCMDLQRAQLTARPVVKPDTNTLVIAAREIAYDFTVQEAMGKERSDALDKALEPFADQVGWDDDLTSEGEAAKPCTCHLDDNPPVPCAQKYALSECLSSPQPAQPDLEVVAWRWRDDDKEQWRTDCGTWYPGHEGAMRARHMHVEPLVRLTDAQAHIAALTAKVEELKDLVADTFATGLGHFQNAETAEARVAQLEEALAPFANLADYYDQNVADDEPAEAVVPNIGDLRRARAALHPTSSREGE